MTNKLRVTYDSEALAVLVYEFPFSNKKETEDTIRRRLQRKKLGDFDLERVSLLRRMKDQLQGEIGKQEQSIYYRGPLDMKTRLEKYVQLNDFDIPKLKMDMCAAYPDIPAEEVDWFVPFAVSIYHLL